MSSEGRTSPEIETLELKLAAGEDQANLGTVMKKVKVKVKLWKGLASHCKAKTTFSFHFSIINA